MDLNRYRVSFRHDNGSIGLDVVAWSEEDAINQVMNFERCPRSAIKSVDFVRKVSSIIL